MINFIKSSWKWLRSIFGLHRNSKYVRDYLNDANVRSAIFMSAIIIALEVWLLIRQTDKYIIPTMTNPDNTNSLFKVIFTNTSNFWLLLSFAVTTFISCLSYKKLEGNKRNLILIIIFATISLVFCALMPFEFIYSKRPITGVPLFLLISFYSAIAVFNILAVSFSVYHYRGGKSTYAPVVTLISLFALVCLIFGVKVSYSDFSSTRTIDGVLVPNPDYKQIICFLMMSMYVGCLLIWKPYISFSILGAVFLGFFLLLENTVSIRKFPEGDQVNYITFFISLTMICISIYNQRVKEAEKDEELEYLATKDPLTNLMSFEYFATMVNKKRMEDIKLSEWVMIFIDILGFKLINEQKGFAEGNEFLNHFGQLLTDTFEDAYISRQANDHFVIFTRVEGIEEKIKDVNEKVMAYDKDIRPNIKAGAFILKYKEEPARRSVEKARYACMELKNKFFDRIILYYDDEMHKEYRLYQYVIKGIDEAVDKGYVKTYYQPVVRAKDNKLIGVEALARWIDPRYGFLPPDKFVGALENAHIVYKLDLAMLRNTCNDIRRNQEANRKPIEVSINFSRNDFTMVDIVSEIEKVVNEYNTPKHLLHIEITESALTEDGDRLQKDIARLHELGYQVWLDDFGSGYSSFNVLKDFNFDMVKLDMKFLSSFNENPKSKVIIDSVVKMAKAIDLATLCEGVETKEQASFLTSIGVDRLQGYLYGKPMPAEDLLAKVNNKELRI